MVLGLGIVFLVIVLILVLLLLWVCVVMGSRPWSRLLLLILVTILDSSASSVLRSTELMVAGAALVVNERVLQRALGWLVQLVVELCLCVRVLKVCLVRGGRVPAKGQRRRVPYLRVDIDRGQGTATVVRRLLLLLSRSGQEVPGQGLRLPGNVLARESVAHILDGGDARRGVIVRLVVHRLLARGLTGRHCGRLLVALLLLLRILLVRGLLRLIRLLRLLPGRLLMVRLR